MIYVAFTNCCWPPKIAGCMLIAIPKATPKAADPKDLNGANTMVTLLETNIAPENRPLEKEIPIGNHHFYRLC